MGAASSGGGGCERRVDRREQRGRFALPRINFLGGTAGRGLTASEGSGVTEEGVEDAGELGRFVRFDQDARIGRPSEYFTLAGGRAGDDRETRVQVLENLIRDR